MKLLRKLGLAASLTLATAVGVATVVDHAEAQDKKFKIYLSLSYSGNSWQSEAANIVKALAQTPPYDSTVELKEVISGTDPQAQISAYESMIQDGADGIISFPISSTALNRTIHRGCEKGVLFFMYDATVTEPCAYNVSYITAGFGENTAQALVNILGGKGKIFLSRGVPGNSVDKRHTDGAMHIFNRYPDIKVVAEYYSYWDDRTTQQETAKALAAHPDVDGIWAQAGEYGAIQALLDKGNKLVPMTGETPSSMTRGRLTRAASATVKSMATCGSHCRTAASRLLNSGTPGSPAAPGTSTPPSSWRPSAAATALDTIRPIRPPAPRTSTPTRSLTVPPPSTTPQLAGR